MLRWITAGESHGPELVAVLEGLPAGIAITTADVQDALARRRLGYGRGARMKFEQDEVSLSGGVRHGLTMGGPVAITVANTEWPKWQDVMSADPVDESKLSGARAEALTRPRPGHADFTGMQKYGFLDSRPILERASARETAARVALGAVAVDEIVEHHTGHVRNVGRVHAHPAPFGAVRQALVLACEHPGERLALEVVVARLDLEIAQDLRRVEGAVIRKQDHVIAVVWRGVRPGGIDHDGAILPHPFLHARMAVIPVGAGLLDRELVCESRPRLDPGERDAGHAVHLERQDQPVPVDRALLGQPVGNCQFDVLPFTQADQRSREYIRR